MNAHCTWTRQFDFNLGIGDTMMIDDLKTNLNLCVVDAQVEAARGGTMSSCVTTAIFFYANYSDNRNEYMVIDDILVWFW